MKVALVLGFLAGCVTATDSPAPAAPGDTLALTWTYGSNSACEGCTERTEVTCTAEISHPCPFVLYTTSLALSADEAVWTDATGGSDANGLPAEHHLPWTDAVTWIGDSVVLPARGDDAGFRHEAHLKARVDGVYEANIEWSLFNVAGYTTFHVEGVLK